MPSGNGNVSGALNGSVVCQSPVVPDDRRVEALLDRGPDAEHRREGEAGDLQVAAVADVDLVTHLVEVVLRGVGGEDIGQAGIHAHARPSASLPARSHSAAMANCSSPSLTPGCSNGPLGCGFDRLIAMSM